MFYDWQQVPNHEESIRGITGCKSCTTQSLNNHFRWGILNLVQVSQRLILMGEVVANKLCP